MLLWAGDKPIWEFLPAGFWKLGSFLLCQAIGELRRGDPSGERRQLEPERLEREREKTEEEVVAQFERWAKNPAWREIMKRE